MAAERRLLISLDDSAHCVEASVGGKAAKLSRLAAAGFRVPRGFCLTMHAYESFARDHGIDDAVRMELGRKPLEGMRWEEMWDSALRIRSLFLARPLSSELRRLIVKALANLDPSRPLAVRSSAAGEDSVGRSFAGLHESFTEVRGEEAVLDAVRLVWASLWSDASLLYRSELKLEPSSSRMGVLVQEMAVSDRSGVAFGRDPRPRSVDQAIVEAVPGPCRLLVDGEVDPDRWEVDRRSRRVIGYRPGQREGFGESRPVLAEVDLDAVVETLFGVEALFDWAPDLEWTGRSESLTVLQARPITTAEATPKDGREWYLTLRPGDARLQALRKTVVEELIPRLESEGARLASEALEDLGNEDLADALDERRASLDEWKQIYWDDFIPFAHGARRLATYYNDAVQPRDPYEFVRLLQDQDMLASRRNRSLEALAFSLAENGVLRRSVSEAVEGRSEVFGWPDLRAELPGVTGGKEWLEAFERFVDEHLDVAYSGERLRDGLRPLLRNLLELAGNERSTSVRAPIHDAAELEERLFDAVGPDRASEARDVLETARLSWRLRDDDNLLVGRIESQLLRAIQEADKQLRKQGRLSGDRRPGPGAAGQLAEALRDPGFGLVLSEPSTSECPSQVEASPGDRPRQLIGQPASPGLATGRVRCVRGPEDLGDFRSREILVCDAIQPTITHLVPLASAIVERRGGMLIHGAIIARELGIPCVNGVHDAVAQLRDGDVVTVDGHLGIVTVGPPEFDLELDPARSAQSTNAVPAEKS